MDKNFISIDLDDPKTGLVAEALSNKTCVKILGLLSEEEFTAGDISSKLKIPLNTTGYNIEKLIKAGLVEKSSNFFWSVKGKKTPVYKVANKKIIISPKKSVKGIIPAVIASGAFALLIRKITPFQLSQEATAKSLEYGSAVSDSLIRTVPEVNSAVSSFSSSGIWAWFFMGALFSLIILFLWDFISSIRRLR